MVIAEVVVAGDAGAGKEFGQVGGVAVAMENHIAGNKTEFCIRVCAMSLATKIKTEVYG